MVILGDVIRVTCNSHTTPKWTFSSFRANARENVEVKKKYLFGNVVYIKYASVDHEGKYKCQGTWKSGKSFNAMSRVDVGCKYLDFEIRDNLLNSPTL